MGTGGVQTAQEARKAPPQYDGRCDQRKNRRTSLRSDGFNASAVVFRKRGKGHRAMTAADAFVATQSGRGTRRLLCAPQLVLSVLGICVETVVR